MLHVTDRIDAIARDLVRRVPTLSHIDMDRVLVFARVGRSGAQGPLATCHCLGLPPSEPGYYFWRSADSGELLRRSPYFVTRYPEVVVRGRSLTHMISVALPRYCDQSLARQPKRRYYRRTEPWIAKLDTIVHELYHIDPDGPGIRMVQDGPRSTSVHGEAFLQQVADLVESYLASGPPADLVAWLAQDFTSLRQRGGGVAATVFREFPAYPRPFAELLDPQPHEPAVPVVSLVEARRKTRFDERDLETRLFDTSGRTRRLSREASFEERSVAIAA